MAFSHEGFKMDQGGGGGLSLTFVLRRWYRCWLPMVSAHPNHARFHLFRSFFFCLPPLPGCLSMRHARQYHHQHRLYYTVTPRPNTNTNTNANTNQHQHQQRHLQLGDPEPTVTTIIAATTTAAVAYRQQQQQLAACLLVCLTP